MVMDICSQSLYYGLGSAAETLVSHAFGAERLRVCAQVNNKIRVMMFVMTIALLIPFYHIDTILIFIGQDPKISYQAKLATFKMMPAFCLYNLNILQ